MVGAQWEFIASPSAPLSVHIALSEPPAGGVGPCVTIFGAAARLRYMSERSAPPHNFGEIPHSLAATARRPLLSRGDGPEVVQTIYGHRIAVHS